MRKKSFETRALCCLIDFIILVYHTSSMFSPTVKFIAIGVIEVSVKKDETDAEQSDQSKGTAL